MFHVEQFIIIIKAFIQIHSKMFHVEQFVIIIKVLMQIHTKMFHVEHFIQRIDWLIIQKTKNCSTWNIITYKLGEWASFLFDKSLYLYYNIISLCPIGSTNNLFSKKPPSSIHLPIHFPKSSLELNIKSRVFSPCKNGV